MNIFKNMPFYHDELFGKKEDSLESRLPHFETKSPQEILKNFPQILLIDDDTQFTDAFTFAFSFRYDLTVSNEESQGLEISQTQPFDLIILDHHLKKLTGLDLVEKIRADGANLNTPILIVTALPDLEMTINYLNTDVQGFLQKPLNYKTIEETITRTLKKEKLVTQQKLEMDWIQVDYQLRKVSFENKNITLTPTELSILDIFLQQPGKAIARDEICEKIWGKRTVSKHAFDTHLLNLRRKVDPFNSRLISVYGSGYILN